MKFLDLTHEYELIDWNSVLSPVFASQQFINGPQVKELEGAIAKKIGCAYAVGVSSGTSAIELAFLTSADSHTSGLTVLTSPYTFIATTEIPYRLGCRIRFCDIGSDFNINIAQAKDILKNEHIDIFMPVHLFGQSCVMDDELLEICRRRGVTIIEDAAQAFGATYHDRQVGTFGDFGCFSFFPSKNLGCAGDGGLVTTNQKSLYEKCLSLRNHGASQKYLHHLHGGNFRLDTLQAALLLAKLPFVDGFIAKRRASAFIYNMFLQDHPEIQPPVENPGCLHTYNQYVLRIRNGKRDVVASSLKDLGIPTMLYYPRCLSQQPCYDGMDYGKCSCVESRRAAEENLALPIAHLSATDVIRIAESVKKAMLYA